MGTDPLQMLGWRGSVLMAYHDSWAVVVEGSLAGVRDVAVRVGVGWHGHTRTHGVCLRRRL